MANLNKKLEANLPADGSGTNGDIYITEKQNMYVIDSNKNKVKITDVLFVDNLPTQNINQNKIYILKSNFSLNIYDGSAWHVVGGNNQISIGTTVPTDTTKLLWLDTTYSTNPILKYYNGTSWVDIGGTAETTATIKTKLGQANETTDGYLSSTDWNTFNNKANTSAIPTKISALTNDSNFITSSNIKAGTNVNLSTDANNNVTIGVTGGDATSINSHSIDNSSYSPNRMLIANSNGGYTHADMNIAGIVGSNNSIIIPSGSPTSIASGQEIVVTHQSITDDKMMICIQEQVAGSSVTDTHLDFSDSSKYILQDSGKMLFNSNKASLDIFTKLLMHMNESGFIDVCGHPIINSGVTLDSTNKFLGVGSAYFNGNSYLKINMGSDLPVSNSSRTISFKFMPTNILSSSNSVILSYGTTTVYHTLALAINPSKKLLLAVGYGAQVVGNTTISINTWYDCVIQHDGFNTKVYLNGNLEISSTNTLNTDNTSLYIGSWYDLSSPQYFYGNIDELKIIKDLALYNTSVIAINTKESLSPYVTINIPLYLKTTGTSNFSLTTIDTITSLTMPFTIPTNTSIKTLVSFDNGTNWLYHDGTGWHKFTGDITQSWTNYNSNTDLQTYFTSLTITQLNNDLSSLGISPITLDFIWQLNTSDLTITPSVSPVTMVYTTKSHTEFASYGRYDETSVTFGIKRIGTSTLAMKNLSNKTRVAIPNVLGGN